MVLHPFQHSNHKGLRQSGVVSKVITIIFKVGYFIFMNLHPLRYCADRTHGRMISRRKAGSIPWLTCRKAGLALLRVNAGELFFS